MIRFAIFSPVHWFVCEQNRIRKPIDRTSRTKRTVRSMVDSLSNCVVVVIVGGVGRTRASELATHVDVGNAF